MSGCPAEADAFENSLVPVRRAGGSITLEDEGEPVPEGHDFLSHPGRARHGGTHGLHVLGLDEDPKTTWFQ